MIQVTVERVGFDQDNDQAVILLADLHKSYILPIWVRTQEAAAIAFPLQDIKPQRPLTADLAVDIIDKLGAQVVMILITEVKDEVFYAVLVLNHGGREIELDSRPSDAIAIALRTSSPIYVADSVMAEAGIPSKSTEVQ
ncbi:MAG TPA: bifunctional nuclease family protein [Firmicutes bacterium]|nr:bifunctional nuclease family protein [Candidatus Fermentithermobacillaceae bacterium]